MAAPLLEIQGLVVEVADQEILKGVDLRLERGEMHAIMGPNGSGKSTLAGVLAGRPDYQVTAGSVLLEGKDLLAMEPEERAHQGLFLAFQYPIEIPGVSNLEFLKAAHDQLQEARGQPPLSSAAFTKKARAAVTSMGLSMETLKRGVNEGFSGGEKKCNEMIQLQILEPELVILDETDSGLDIDALRTVAAAMNQMRSPDRGFLMITHYQRVLEHVRPDKIHILADGRILRSGDQNLALEIEEKGYSWLAP